MNEKVNEYSQKIFDDYESITKKEKNNWLSNIFQIFIFLFFVIATSLIFVFIERTFFINKSIQNFFIGYNIDQKLEIMIIIYRFSIIGFAFFYSIYKNFTNIKINVNHITRYIVWYILYFCVSIISFFLLFFYLDNNVKNVIYLTFLLFILYIINTGYSINFFLLKRKSHPLLYKSSKMLIISLISQFILFLILFILSFTFVYSVKSDVIYSYNIFNTSFYLWIHDVFTTKNFINLVIIMCSFSILGILLFGANYEKINFIAFNKYNKKYLRHNMMLNFAFFISIVIFVIKLFSLNFNDPDYKITKQNTNDYLYLLLGIFGLIISILYIFIMTYKKTKIKGIANNSLCLSTHYFLIWTLLLISSIWCRNNLINLINILLISSSSICVFWIFLYTIKNKNVILLMFISLLSLLNIISLFIFGLNYLLIANKNNMFLTIASDISINNIILLIVVFLSIIFIIYNIANLLIILIKIKTNDLNNKEKYEKERK
ncbi:MSC_0624 family F1-like ATPase-associated membrane protein [Mycoplasma elephantis]|uniref:MSC_0624 family F1-like ATPase-associated membrane protein n=1 Tax=Mycoplasma elephantis TaxID=114882 RepID=UPI00048202B5